MKLTNLRMLITGIFTTPVLVSCIYSYEPYEATPYEPQFSSIDEYTYCFDDQYEKEFDTLPYDYIDDYTCVEPVYLNLTVLRDVVGVDMTTPKQIEKAGKLYGYSNHLFTVDELNGIGIWELNYKQTTQIGYLSIPGVTNLSIRNDVLFANSFMDLVKVDLLDFNKAPTRLKDVFEYDMFEANRLLPVNTYFYESDMNVTNGIIIGYKETDSVDTILF
ncbi:hypothetical protein [Marinicellulosiphila megalodicopiae]|uniref:hypothetical protein n=1 Tax=Marinicellulosiphila megalodicopiae TaxID=2724896 RepID=UPI003BB0A8F3